MTFSARTSQHDVPNPLAEAVRHARARAAEGGAALLDLTVGNPTSAGFPYATEAILAALADPRGLVYEPEPLGIASAREAVARDWTARGTPIEASRIALTASTSEAYAVLFKVLCDPGDEVLVPAPSYPLLGFLAAFESVTLKTYPLVYAGGWHVDLDALTRAVGPRTKAIVVVSPNNPTGLVSRRARARGDARSRAPDRERRGVRDLPARRRRDRSRPRGPHRERRRRPRAGSSSRSPVCRSSRASRR